MPVDPGKDYVVTASGVRWRSQTTGEAEDEATFVREMGRMMGAAAPEIAIHVRENIRPAMLDFPCSPAQALKWVLRDDGRSGRAPEWLKEALAQPDVDRALAVVEGAQVEPAEDVEEERQERESIRLFAEALRVIMEDAVPVDTATVTSAVVSCVSDVDAHAVRKASAQHAAREKIKQDKDGKQAAKAGAKELWKDWKAGQHPNLRTTEHFAGEVMRRWPVLKSAETIRKWSAEWEKERRLARL